MRRMIRSGIAGLFALSISIAAGCSEDKKTVVPDKQVDLPKEGPVPAGGGKSGAKGGLPGGPPPSSDQ